ncbi:hypothetical protein E5288_WYG012971 [Bos mutus]|uniref:Uncharacterized protein n=1 Tax=Bos mutus TaxID=72004 RepID=A0A6B0R9Q5_9CETA|nr:hypothetical protein [Bos mutus]
MLAVRAPFGESGHLSTWFVKMETDGKVMKWMPNSHSCDYMIIKSVLPKLKLASSLTPPFGPHRCKPDPFLKSAAPP